MVRVLDLQTHALCNTDSHLLDDMEGPVSFVFSWCLGVGGWGGGRSRDDIDVDAFLWKCEHNEPSDLVRVNGGQLVFEPEGDVFEGKQHYVGKGVDGYV